MALLSRIIGSRLVRYGFVVVTVALGGWAIASRWHDIGPALGKIGLPISLASLALTLLALVASMWTWRVLLAGLGSPLRFSAAARVMFVGQLGKYLPGGLAGPGADGDGHRLRGAAVPRPLAPAWSTCQCRCCRRCSPRS